MMKRKQFAEAKPHLQHLVKLGAVTGDDDGPLAMLAVVYRELNEPVKERETLERMIGLKSNALPALQRLITIYQEKGNWGKVAEYGEMVLSINPLLPSAQSIMAESSEQLKQPEIAVRALSALARMEPIDPAGLNYRMARSLTKLDRTAEAKEKLIAALDEAPRYRDAHRLLLTLVKKETADPKTADQETAAAEVPSEVPQQAEVDPAETSNTELPQ